MSALEREAEKNDDDDDEGWTDDSKCMNWWLADLVTTQSSLNSCTSWRLSQWVGGGFWRQNPSAVAPAAPAIESLN